MSKGHEAILIGGGPSFGDVDQESLRSCGAVTMTLNNAILSFKSNLWLGVDPPKNFARSLWIDPAIQKFSPLRNAARMIAGRPVMRADACPNTWFYNQSKWFKCEQMFAPNDPGTWDNRMPHGGPTSFMDAIRVLYLLGIRRIFLFGIDFHQSQAHTYHYAKRSNHRTVTWNNQLYEGMSSRLAKLRPLMEDAGLRIVNCNPTSRLDTFDFMAPEDAFQAIAESRHARSRARLPAGRTVIIDGMHGLGDSIYARPVIRAACERHHQVLLRTPWPQLYWDMQETYGLRFLRPRRSLRTATSNMTAMPPSIWSEEPDVPGSTVKLKYQLECGAAIARLLERCLALGATPFDFSLPIHPDWAAEADRLLRAIRTDRPIALYRPVTIRREWPAPARNPDPTVVREVGRWLKSNYFVLSVASLKPGEERIAAHGMNADRTFHSGEVRPEVLAALMQRVALTVTAPGFAMPMSLAVNARSLVMFGGYAHPDRFIDPRINSQRQWRLAPEPFCDCLDRRHDCQRAIAAPTIAHVLDAIQRDVALELSGLRHDLTIS